MKASPKISILLLFLVILSIAAGCSDSNSDNVFNVNPETPESVTSKLSQGTWKISYFFSSDHDETSQFENFNFKFTSTGIVTVTDENKVHTGTFNVEERTLPALAIKVLVLEINFNDDVVLLPISDSWEIDERSITSSLIELTEFRSDATSHKDKLTFTKN